MRIVSRFLIIATILLSSSVLVRGDSGQIVVVIPKKQQPTDVKPSVEEKPLVEDKTETPIELPKPLAEDSLGNFFPEGRSGRISLFEEKTQQAVIAWNGREELLVLSTHQKSLLPPNSAVVSIVPLPGKPIRVEKGDTELFKKFFDKIVDLSRKQYQLDDNTARGDGLTILTENEIGAHHIIAFRVEDVNTFYAKLQDYISVRFGSKATALLGPREKNVFDFYIKEKGFRYFAVDIQKSQSEKESKQKEAIAYHFESDHVFFPLYVSRLGGTKNTCIQLVVISPDVIKDFRGVKVEQITPTVSISNDEIALIDKDIAKMMSNSNRRPSKARVWIIEGAIDKFEKDLVVFP